MASRLVPPLFLTSSAVLLLLPAVTAQGNDGGFPTGNETPVPNSVNLFPRSNMKKYHRVLIAHAVLGTLAWALLAPIGAVLLRVNIRGTNLLRLHISCQLLVYLMYASSAALGIYLRYQLDSPYNSHSTIWAYPHAAIGMLVLFFMAIQPLLGWTHHLIFKRRFNALKDEETSQTQPSKKPGRTAITHAHLWLGRLLILVAIANGGLGIHVTGDSYLQSGRTSRVALIAYCIVAGCIALPVTYILVSWEWRRARGIRRARLELNIPPLAAVEPPPHGEGELEKKEEPAGTVLGDEGELLGVTLFRFEDVSRQSLEVGKKTLEIVGGSGAATKASSIADGGSHDSEALRKYSVVSVGGLLP